VLFSALHFANLRIFESVVRELAARGHQVRLLADEPETFGGQALVERLAAAHPTVSWGWAPSVKAEPWFPVAQKVRFGLDYVRFVHRRYRDAPKLRLRNIGRAPRLVRWLTTGVGTALGLHRPVMAALQWIERRMPVSASMRQLIEDEAPDVVVLTALTVSRSSATDQLKAARALGVPVAAAIQSWDHLSSKAPLHLAPDVTIVWNDVQRREAVEMHGLTADTVTVTGAQCYDQWFDRQPTRSREEFGRDLGLDLSRPFVLYVASAMSPVPEPLEPHFVREWVAALRTSGDARLRDVGILIRPHPERVREWEGVSLDGLDRVVMNGRAPIDRDAKADYFDSLYYCAAVAGLCTSAFIEAAIVGRPVLTLLLPAYRIHQDGMAHFRYLLTVNGGLLHTATDMPSHLRQLAEAVTRQGADERAQRFVEAFVRPFGRTEAATPRFADAVERVARRGRSAPVAALGRSILGTRIVERLCVAGTRGVGEWLMMDESDIERAERNRVTNDTREQRLAGHAARREVEQRAREDVLRRTEEERERKQEAQLARRRVKEEQRLAAQHEGERRAHRKRRSHQWRQWRYRLGTEGPMAMLRRSLQRRSGASGR
jgi:hypothetical protein